MKVKKTAVDSDPSRPGRSFRKDRVCRCWDRYRECLRRVIVREDYLPSPIAVV